MAITSEYLNRLLLEVEQGLVAEQGGVPSVSLRRGSEGLLVDMAARNRRLVYEVDEVVYHYGPDGSDVSRHATWLVQLFDEEAR